MKNSIPHEKSKKPCMNYVRIYMNNVLCSVSLIEIKWLSSKIQSHCVTCRCYHEG